MSRKPGGIIGDSARPTTTGTQGHGQNSAQPATTASSGGSGNQTGGTTGSPRK